MAVDEMPARRVAGLAAALDQNTRLAGLDVEHRDLRVPPAHLEHRVKDGAAVGEPLGMQVRLRVSADLPQAAPADLVGVQVVGPMAAGGSTMNSSASAPDLRSCKPSRWLPRTRSPRAFQTAR
jgi:hypothetical protein